MIGRREEIQLLKKAYESPYSEFVTGGQLLAKTSF